MRLLVTGASSFVGAHLCTLAAREGHEVLGLWNNTPLLLDGVTSITADLRSFVPAKIDVVVHLATKVMAADAREQNRRMLDSVLAWGLPLVYASSTVVHWPRRNAYAESRVEDEERVCASGLPWVIVRPCAPYGPRHATHRPAHVESFHRLAALARHAPVVPVIGDGRTLRQPVHVDDFNGAILGLLRNGVCGAAFDAGGPEALPISRIIDILAGRHRRLLRIPEAAAATLGYLLPGFSPDVLRTFATDDTVDPGPLAAASGVVPRAFSADV